MRAGKAQLVSKAEDSVLILKFSRRGGGLVVSGRLEMNYTFDEDLFDEKVSYFEQIDSEFVGAFLKELRDEMMKVRH